MNKYYDRLMEYVGADELKTLIQRWEILSENLNKRSFDAPIILPDLFIYTTPGYGHTKLWSLLAEYINSKGNLMSFYGDVKFFEFKLDYCPPDREFRELYRLIEAVENAAGFRSEFKGIIRINVDEWVRHHKEKYFLEFLQFLQFHTAYWLVILTISDRKENEDTKAMEAVISMYLRHETITLHLPTNDELVTFAEKHFTKYDLTLDDSAKEILKEAIDVLKKNAYFYGLRTVTDLCNDIVYSIYSASTDVSRVITADMLGDFRADGEYIKRTIMKAKKAVALGF
ncbi:MAG: hypothetical protein IKM59_00290 [Oscillospiraceae bacterium]|nr:hypothetical protein [Oscillospiraceae bacterium]